jgi:hypothetical protein
MLYTRYGLIAMVVSYFPWIIYMIVFHVDQIVSVWNRLWRRGAVTSPSTHSSAIQTSLSSSADELDSMDAQYIVKHLFYSIFECTYFSGIYPLIFVPDYIYFDVWRITAFLLFIGLNSFAILSLQLLHSSFAKILLYTHTVGCWVPQWMLWRKKLVDTSASSGDDENSNHANHFTDWSASELPYPKDTLVRYNGQVYVGLGDQNRSIPGEVIPVILFFFFEKPDRSHTLLILFQATLTVLLLMLLIAQSDTCCWEVYFIQLLFNYFIFYSVLAFRTQVRSISYGSQTQAPNKNTS